jgi:hypothetical protein
MSEPPGMINMSTTGKQGMKRMLETKTLETKYNAIMECKKGQKSQT